MSSNIEELQVVLARFAHHTNTCSASRHFTLCTCGLTKSRELVRDIKKYLVTIEAERDAAREEVRRWLVTARDQELTEANLKSKLSTAEKEIAKLRDRVKYSGCGKTFIDCFVLTICKIGSLCPECIKPLSDTKEDTS